MPMNAAAYRESLRRYKPRVWVDGERIESVADAPQLRPGINAMGVTYDYALRDDLAPVMRAVQASSGRSVNRMLQTDSSSADLLNKLEVVRILCQETGCAQRYLAHDGFAALQQTTARVDAETGSRYGERFLAYLHDFQDKDLCLGIAMTDAKGDRSKRPHEQANRTATSTSSSAAPRGSSSRAPRRSSPARPTCTSSWSCRAATWARPTPTSRSAAPCPATPTA